MPLRRPATRPAVAPELGLHGAGMISAVHAMAAAALGVRIGPVASRTDRRARDRASRLGGRPVRYEDLPAGADLVVVATPPGDHAAAALRLMAAGAAVLVEKPLCTTAAQADALVAATDAGGRLVYAENLAFAPAVEAFLATCGRAGPLHHLEARALQGRPTWGEFLTEGWGGGALFDLGAHPIALVLLAAGAARPVAVQGVLRGGPTTDEHGTARIRFDDGLVATVVASWLDGPAPLWDVEAAGAGAVARLELLPAASLELDGRPVALPPSTTTPAVVEELGYLGQLRHAVAVATGAPARIGAAFGRAVLDVTLGAYASAGRGGEWVPLPWDGPRDRTPLQLWRA